MARSDMVGMFWNDTPPPKPPKKTPEKKTPPPRTWENDTYLPNLEEALAFNVHVMDDNELYEAVLGQEKLVFDIEVYSNYFLAAFMSLKTKKVWFAEFEKDGTLDIERLTYVLQNFCTIGFNSLSYDIPMTTLALSGCSTDVLKVNSDLIIMDNVSASLLLRNAKTKKLKRSDSSPIDHIDIIEVAPSMCSLKIYAGRMGARRMQDLPFDPSRVLTPEQIACVRWYCINDLINTGDLYNKMLSEIELRETMSKEYGIDLRSKSDAQIAESVIAMELEGMNRRRPVKPEIAIGTCYKYEVPIWIKYFSPTMQWALDIVKSAIFVVGDSGAVGMPQELSDLKIEIGNSVYRMGIGGLHSSEKSKAHHADEDTIIVDRDVTSYYPFIILLLGLFPKHLGPNFLIVYRQIVDRRLSAKEGWQRLSEIVEQAGLEETVKIRYVKEMEEFETISDSLKITINGSFGKLGSPYSVLYAPDLLIQVTVTGQLTLLMLIERLELSGIQVVSANTDGVVIKCPKHLEAAMDNVVKHWELETGFNTGAVRYKSIYSRDVNNYIAIKEKGGVKTKGIYGSSNLRKNPQNQICSDAVVEFLTTGKPIAQTLWECKDITKFVTVRTVKGGAVKIWEENIEYLGKAIRWYYATGVTGEIVYALSGNKVSRSDGAQPLMDLPEVFPANVDYDWYERECLKMLALIGYGV